MNDTTKINKNNNLMSYENDKKEKKIIKGMVVDCQILNIRKDPNIESEIIGVLEKNSIVTIDELHIDGDFYFIISSVGLTGYCMKRYINIL